MIFNDKGNLDDHLIKLIGKAKGTILKIKNLIFNSSLYNNSSKIAIFLVNTILIPNLTYGLEACIMGDNELEQLERTYIKSIRDLWNLTSCTGPQLFLEN